MRPLIEERDGDDAGYVERVRAIVAGVLRDRRVEEAVVVRIDNWFDRKWLGFSTPRAIGPRQELTLPPFHPHRVESWRRYAWSGYAERFLTTSAPWSERPHRLQPSAENLGRRVAGLAASTAFVWTSGNTERNGRGSLMVYVVRDGRTDACYASLVCDGEWKLAAVAGIAQSDVERLADEGAELERAARERVLPEEEALARELHRAIDAENLVRVSELVGGDVDLEGRDEWTCTPLLRAIWQDAWDCVDLLLVAGANPYQETHYGWTALHGCVNAAWNEPEPERLLRALLDRGVAVDARTKAGCTALMLAAQLDRTQAARILLAAGADVRAKDELGWTALHHACYEGAIGTARLLVDAGARVGARDKMRSTPLLWAALAGHAGAVELLHAAGASVEVRGKGALTPLQAARRRGHAAVVALLLRLGAEA